MGTALRRRNRVRVGVHRLRVRRCPLHRDLHRNLAISVFRVEVDDLIMNDLNSLRGVEVVHIVQQPSVILIGHSFDAF